MASLQLPPRRLLVVMGATGAQGHSVVRHAVERGGWRVRALTRDPKAEKAQQLQRSFPDIELVQGDADDEQSLQAAFAEATAVFAMTDFYTPSNLDRLKKEGRLGEVEQSVRIADACKAAAVRYVVWSALHNSEQLSASALEDLEGTRPPQAIMFTAKNMGEQYARSIGLNVIGMWPGWFLQNIPTGLMPAMKVLESGTLEWSIPVRADMALPTIDIDQFGQYVLQVLEEPERWTGKRVLAASEYLTLDQMARQYEEVSGQRTRFRPLTYDEYREQQASTPWVEVYVEMFRYFNLRGYFAGESLAETEASFGLTATFRDWLVRTGWCADLEQLKKEGQKAHAAAVAAGAGEKEEQERVKRFVRSSARDLLHNSPGLKDVPADAFFARK